MHPPERLSMESPALTDAGGSMTSLTRRAATSDPKRAASSRSAGPARSVSGDTRATTVSASRRMGSTPTSIPWASTTPSRRVAG